MTCSLWMRPSTNLGTEDPQAAELVKLRFFAGMTIDEAAKILECRSADRRTAPGPTPEPGCAAQLGATMPNARCRPSRNLREFANSVARFSRQLRIAYVPSAARGEGTKR